MSRLAGMKRFHFVGLGGIGMSGLAEILLRRGFEVSGSDVASTPLLDHLRDLGAQVFLGHRPQQVEGAQVVVYSSAIPPRNPELQQARHRGLMLLHRSELLAELTREQPSITISGTHGKTTTTAMIAFLAQQAGLDPTVLVGARLEAFGSNARLGRGGWLVAEADESDRSFLRLESRCAVVTNIDRDHLEEYGTLEALQEAFLQYMNGVSREGLVVACQRDANVRSVLKNVHRPVITYGLESEANICARELELGWSGSRYECFVAGVGAGTVALALPGVHNVLNSLAAVAVGLRLLRLPFDVIQRALGLFRGAERRLEWKGERGGVGVLDDYGHHPTEIRATLAACRRAGRRLVVVFQPHRYSRTRQLMEELAESFSEADRLYLMDIYGAGEVPVPGVDSRHLAREIERHREVVYCPDRRELLEALESETEPGDLLITLGAGDVWQIGESFLERRPED